MHHIYINGINTTYEEGLSNARYLTTLTDKKHNIGFFYNATHGNMDDVYHARMTLEGLVTTPSFQLRDEVMQILTRDYRNKVNLIPHSFGGAVTHHAVNMLPKVLKERVMVHAFAPAKICTPDLAKIVENYKSSRDFVPYLDFKNKENRKYLKILPADKDASLFDHAFQSPTFKDTLFRILKRL